jgi:uncharacterized protein (TIGR02452 family)
MKRSERVTIAKETVGIIESGAYRNSKGDLIELRGRIDACVRSTKLLLPDELERLVASVLSTAPKFEHTAFEVRNETSLEGAVRLVRSGSFVRTAVLNFASARNPGGGFLNGSQAQEESLARSSALYASLTSCFEFYDFHRRLDSLLYTDRMIYSPDCPVFRDDSGALLDAPHVVDFITSPAPNAGAVKHNTPAEVALIPAVLNVRAAKLLALAASRDCDALVLGAWGCGVFKNSPQQVAETFRDLLAPVNAFSGRFKHVLFSVYDGADGAPAFAEFMKAFAPLPTSSA